MPRLRAYALCGLVGVTLAACELLSSTDSPTAEEPLLPLAVGHRWVMEHISTDTTGRIIATGVDTFAVTGDTTIGGQTWYFVEKLGQHSNLSCFTDGLYANRPDGLWKFGSTTAGLGPRLVYQYPASEGESLAFSDSSFNGAQHYSVTFLEADAPFDLEGIGEVSSRHYMRTTTRVSSWGAVFEGDLDLHVRFSREYGLLQHEGFFLALREGKLVPYGRLSWRLLEFIPASG